MSIVTASALLLMVPLLFAALGGLIHAASGVINLGIEGQMLIGALIGGVASAAAGSWVWGILAAALAGGIGSLLMTLVITRLHANEIIVGLGFNIAVAGLIGFVLRWNLGIAGTYRIDGLQRIPRWQIPGIDSIPVLRELLSGKDALFWIAILLIPLMVWVLRNTRFGLRVRASGNAADAAASLGVRVAGIREAAGFVAGALAGVGGAYLSLAQVGLFNDQMIAGRGFIALAAFFFGRNKPVPTALACLIFAFFDALQIGLQSGGALAQLITPLPYLMVVVALTLSALQQKTFLRRTLAK